MTADMSVIVDIDLRSLIGQVRNQGLRLSCLAFATTAAHEASRSSVDYLSVEHLFYSGVQRSHKNPMRGLNQVSVAEALGHDGQPIEAEWPYSEVVPDPATWTPPTAKGAMHRATIVFSSRTVGDVRGMIESGVPVVLITTLTMAMYSPDEDGIVRSEATDVVNCSSPRFTGCGFRSRGGPRWSHLGSEQLGSCVGRQWSWMGAGTLPGGASPRHWCNH